MKFLKNICNLGSKGIFFKSSMHELDNFLCGMGTVQIEAEQISFSEYPFAPSLVYPNKTIYAKDIEAVLLKFAYCKVFIGDDVVFISRKKMDKLKYFAERHNIAIVEYNWNWDYILEPYLDTELSEEESERTLKNLSKNGIEESEVEALRQEVGEQMYKYNFDTMLWEWISLSLPDVLFAMRVKYNEAEFQDFYKRAIEIEKRCGLRISQSKPSIYMK